ncbi:AGC family protein kinase [Histomonas meleagridis]|uniref:AGC family protein kinase n=1 Tax=Histomonas meleagridis TaxID=135588 RepID=UPI003559FE4F|nr:AGC family protein kinase [Histomonas meleagridis]KAH0806753.1 AGC family protein kinase [Histomonas meleagridis]
MSLFASTLTNLIGDGHSIKQDEILGFSQVGVGTYSKTYIFLKAQRTILEDVQSTLNKLIAGTKSSSLDYIQYLVESLLLTNFGCIFQQAKNAIPSLRAFIESEKLPTNIKKLCQKVLSSSIALSRVFSIIECVLPAAPQHPVDEIPKPTPRVEDMLVLCRICEEYVPLSLIESHSNSCMRAYESECKIMTVDDRITKLENSIRNNFLNHTWPGDEDKCVGTYLPMFHLVLLLEKVRKASTSSARDADVIAFTNKSLKTIQIPPDQNAESMLTKAKELTIQKLHACSSLTNATNELQSTRVTGNEASSISLQVSIADFEFVKAISSGAYARVFLAIKKKTGDIYAIKVTSRASLAQKNQLQRLITEKDILLQNDNPYIVNFCMFFLAHQKKFQ